MDFNPRSPRGERQYSESLYLQKFSISIHAPREGSDFFKKCWGVNMIDFNPRSPRGERHAQALAAPRQPDISIHAPREGSDI